MKLGELLVRAGKISAAQLEETLKGQAIFGGKLGTNLVEMGYLDEEDLAHFLSQKTGVPPAPTENLMNIPAEVKRLLPEDTVRTRRVVPLALHNKKLLLAMADPNDFSTIDEISFLTGYNVVPLVVPELHLVNALERHYNIKREMRYIAVPGGRSSRRAAAKEPPPVSREAAPSPTAPSPTAPSPAKPSPPSPKVDDEEILELPETAEYFGDPDDNMLAPSTPSASPSAPRPPLSLEDVHQGLCDAQDRHDIAEVLVEYTAQQFEVAALFLVRGEKVSGWAARRRGEPLAGLDALEFSLEEPSVFKTVAEHRTFHLGPLPISPANGRLAVALHCSDRSHTLLIPLQLMGRMVGVLFVQGDAMQLGKELPKLNKLLGKASVALEILILKGKILAQ